MADGREPAEFVRQFAEREHRELDPARRNGNGVGAPNYGQVPVPHVLSFTGLLGTISRVYRDSDEALQHSLANARHMRNDCGIMECLEQRQRLTALLDWHLEPEDEGNAEHQALCDAIEKILRRIKRFTEYRRVLMEAIWHGRQGVQHAYNWTAIGGRMRCMPWPSRTEQFDSTGWQPINGDKLVWRQDDGTGRVEQDKYPSQMGIRVGARFAVGTKINNRWPIEATDRGLAYFLAPWEREMIAVHKHMVEDAAWEDPAHAGSIHGVGIRSRIYWDWFQKQEALALLMEYLERSAGGIELWYFPSGNKKAEEETREAAQERVGGQRNIVLVPRPIGEDGHAFGVEIIEPGMAGVEQLKDLLISYFGHRIKRYILGQILSSESDATGLGSGVADLHFDTLMSIVRYDATNLEETITDQLVLPIQKYNFPWSQGIHVRFVIDTESPDVEKKLEAARTVWEMGARIKERDVMDMVGLAIPSEEDRVLENPQAGGQGMMDGMMPGMGGMPGMDEQPPGQGGNGSPGNGKSKQKKLFDTGDRIREDA